MAVIDYISLVVLLGWFKICNLYIAIMLYVLQFPNLTVLWTPHFEKIKYENLLALEQDGGLKVFMSILLPHAFTF